MDFIICRGLPASGKTTWTREIQNIRSGVVRINLDDFGSCLFGDSTERFNNGNLAILLKVQEAAIRAAAASKKDIIVDNTNLNPNTLQKMLSLGEELGYCPLVRTFPTGLQECINRNNHRTGRAYVPPSVIVKMFNDYVKGTTLEV